jgi:serine/threonine-protein kinase
MGEVYRARDERLDRDVAIKVLPEEVAQDEARLARFEREAKLLASLSHQNIATLYGLEEVELPVAPSDDRGRPQHVIPRSFSDEESPEARATSRSGQSPEDSGDPSTPAPLRDASAQDDSSGVRTAEEATLTIRFLVMELAEGETLAERVKKGPIPVDDALPIALQIAEGLEAAHEQGIIHRDLKPANVMLSPEGKVKILDFGLAKAWHPEDDDPELTHSPTLTAQMTAAGVLLGTAAYMSPEQARGKPIDKRADIWAFGVVLWEMLTGRRLFQGETTTDVLSNILKTEPDWEALPSATPRRVDALLRRCLVKDPHDRLRDIGDARIEIRVALGEGLPDREAGVAVAPGFERRLRRAIGMSGLAGLLVGSLLVAVVGSRFRAAPPRPTSRFTISLAASEPPPHGLAFSPDGTRLVWAGSRLYQRHLDRLDAVPIPETEGAATPFFSPGGEWIGFISTTARLCKVRIEGGAAVTLADAYPTGTRPRWAPDDTIVFTNTAGGISRISAHGGEPAVLATPEGRAEGLLASPQLLPRSRAVLYHDMGTGRIFARRLDTSEIVELGEGWEPRYLPTGHLLFLTASAVVARPFDPARLEFTGPPRTAIAGVRGTRGYPATIAVSRTGSLAFVPPEEGQLVWVDHDGATDPVTDTLGPYSWPRISPDQRRIAVAVQFGGLSYEIWLHDLRRDAFTRLRLAGEANLIPSWSVDGRWITTTSVREGRFNLFSYAVDGSGREVRLTRSDLPHWPGSWSPDGMLFVYQEQHPESGYDIWVLATGEDEPPRALLRTQANEAGPIFSPDGRWLAYSSDESGRDEVYVTAFPEAGARVQVSTDGGLQPVWDPDGRTLYYRNGERMMAVQLTYLPALEAGRPEVLFSGSFGGAGRYSPSYDITADGERFLMVAADPGKIVVVLNWFEELKRLVPTE